MRQHLFGLLAAPVLLAAPLFAGEPQSPAGLAKKIDARINECLARDGVTPAPRADDAEFVRRAYLDIGGRIPLSSDVYEFLADKSADKRQKLVNKLLDGAGFVNHFTDIWTGLFLPEAASNLEVSYFQIGFDAWVRKRVSENTPWDKLARDLITVPIGANSNNGFDYNEVFSGRENAIGYFQAKEGKPENIAAAPARIFLGIHIECAQCHNHPFAKWSREQFWSTAAFFAGVERPGNQNFFTPLREVVDRREAAIPNTDKVVQAAFLDDKEPRWKFKTSSRAAFAEWMTAPDNPFFARTAVNRIWAQMFGVGIVDPPDDFNEENKASHPELLDELAKAFIDAKYDVKFLIRAIAATDAYQRTSAQTDSTQSNPRLLARMPVKAMTGEQLFDSVAAAIGFIDPTPRNQPAIFYGGNSPRTEFVSKFAGAGRPTEAQTSILQALMLMNGKFIANGTLNTAKMTDGTKFGSVAGVPFWTTTQRIEALYTMALARKPRPEELDKLVKYVDAGDSAKQTQRLGDVFWTLLNSIEFRVNH